MIEIKDKSDCMGCTACYNVCPQKCITMQTDEEGFLYPNINTDDCINCNVCDRICPLRKETIFSPFVTLAFATQAKDSEIRNNSSSGGAFSVMAHWILQQKGVVFGAGYDKDFNVIHYGVEDYAELSTLRGSKYVQSNLRDTFNEVRNHLMQNKWVLYSGTPCQIAGLKSFLKQKTLCEKLILLDLVCHGIPSPKVWQKYLLYNKTRLHSDINFVSFRHKKYGYAGSTMALGFTNGKIYYSGRDIQFFKYTFFEDINTRPSCFKCHFKTIKRESDITLYDCWHVNEFDKTMDDDKGTTMVLIHSDRGRKLFDMIKQNLRFCPAKVEKAIDLDGVMAVECTKSNPKREAFFKDLDVLDMRQIINKYFPLTLKKRLVFALKPLFYHLGLIKVLKR